MTWLCLGDFLYDSVFFIFFGKPVDNVERDSPQGQLF